MHRSWFVILVVLQRMLSAVSELAFYCTRRWMIAYMTDVRRVIARILNLPLHCYQQSILETCRGLIWLYTSLSGHEIQAGFQKLAQLVNLRSERLCTYCLLELGRYWYLESVSVFGIFVGIFSCRFGIRYRYFEIPPYSVSVSVFLKYWLKIANFWNHTSPLCLAPLLRVTPSEFRSRFHFWKTRMMGPPGVEKVW